MSKDLLLSDVIDDQLIDDLITVLCEREFKTFVKQAWNHTEPSPLVWNWHLDVICDTLQLVSEGKIKRLIINIPPGMGKSLITSVFWLAWDWLLVPSRYSIYATYAAALSNKFAKKHRDLVKSDWYQEHWGENTDKNIVIDGDSTQRKQEFENNHLGGRFSTGKGGEVTGRRGNIILFDDLNKSQDATGKTGIIGEEIAKGVEYLAETLWSRRILTNDESKKTAFVGICQRLHYNDVAQWCIDQRDENDNPVFVHLNLPMECIEEEKCFILKMPDGSYRSALGAPEAQKLIEQGAQIWFEDPRKKGELLFPQLFNEKEVEELKKSLGPINASAQLQQKPTPPGGSKFDISWLKEYRLSELKEKIIEGNGEGIISVDTTDGGNDWVVIQCWKSFVTNSTTEYYLLDQYRARTNLQGTIEGILNMHKKWNFPKTAIIEEAANGRAAIELLKDKIRAPGLLVKGYRPKISKEGRLEHSVPLIQEGRVYIPVDGDPSINELKKELQYIGYYKHDDTVDSFTQAMIWYQQQSSERYARKTDNLLNYYSRFGFNRT